MFHRFIRDVIETLGEYGDERFIRESEHADLSTTIAFKLAKERKKSPADVAGDIVSNLQIRSDYIGRVESVNGYVNFFASYEFLEDTIDVILDMDERYGDLNLKGDVLVEHTSANPDGPLHIGHIRNSIIGDTLARIFRKAGMDVTTHYYVNDMGRQIAITVLGAEKFGIGDGKPDHAVSEVYVKMNRLLEEKQSLEDEVEKLMLKYEEGDEEVTTKFRYVVQKALDGIEETLKRLGIKHDDFIWESDFIRNGYVDKVLETLDKLGAVKKDGAWILDLKDVDKEVVLKRENGTTLYITRDLAYHVWKNERFSRLIDVLGADHKLYASQLGSILRLLGSKEPEVVFFEFVSLPEGSMSTRKGKFISADELIERVKDEARKILEGREMSEEEKEEVAEAVAIGALRYDFVKVAPEKPMVFDWNKALDFERQTASYIQYAHARACSILRKAVSEGMIDLEFKGEICNLQERRLVMLLSKLPYYIQRVVRELRPNLFAEYTLSVASAFNDFYRENPVLKAKDEIRLHRLAIVDATRIVLRNSLELLGIRPLERM
jgi:arginyl-tRNA synthetase